jgi:hypothetical protein
MNLTALLGHMHAHVFRLYSSVAVPAAADAVRVASDIRELLLSYEFFHNDALATTEIIMY